MKRLCLANGKVISEGERPYFIAEVGSNHNGDMGKALELIDVASEAGADCVKFQSVSIGSLYSSVSPELAAAVDLITLNCDDLAKLAEHAKKRGIDFTSTPTYVQAAIDLKALDVPFLKIASLDCNNHGFIQQILELDLPVIFSRGMTDFVEIAQLLDLISRRGVDASKWALLHCVSSYPLDPAHANLNQIKTLNALTKSLVGYSDHTESESIPSVAVAMGAAIIEKHFTLDRSQHGFDHFYALSPDGLKRCIASVTDTFLALGESDLKVQSCELGDREMARRSVIAARDIQPGSLLEAGDLKCVRPGGGIPPNELSTLIGRKVKVRILENEQLSYSNLV